MDQEHELSRAELVIAFIEQTLFIPEGKFVGKPVQLRDWQKKIITQIYDTPECTQAIISIGRKNAKTTLIAMLMAAHLMGPVALQNSQIYSAAQSREQASIVFNLLAKMLRQSAILFPHVRIVDSAKTIYCGQSGVEYKALSAEASTAFGLSPAFVVHDELGQVTGPMSKLYEALETAMGANDTTLSIVISTQAPTDTDLLSVLIDDAKKANDPSTQLILFEVPLDADPFEEKNWYLANPALGDFLSLDDFRNQADRAKRMPAREASFRNLKLNQRVTVHNLLLTKSVWDQNNGEPDYSLLDNPHAEIVLGLDLSARQDLTSCVATIEWEGVQHIFPYFWTPEQTLDARSLVDRAPYRLWVRDGHLMTTSGSSINYDDIATWLANNFGHRNVKAIVFDRWRIEEFKRCLERVSWMPQMIPHGQGLRDMSPSIDNLEHLALESCLLHGDHPVLTYCVSNTVVTIDKAGNKSVNKAAYNRRMDGAVALIMALRSEVGETAFDIEAMIA
jgi:phage terminase large subunit-like protein